MANLHVRQVDDDLVQALKERAARNNRSAEAEHRAILVSVLRSPARKTFAEALMSIPNVGDDGDFERVQDETAADVFD